MIYKDFHFGFWFLLSFQMNCISNTWTSCEEQKQSLSLACIAWWRFQSHTELQIVYDTDSVCGGVESVSWLLYTSQVTKYFDFWLQ